MANEKVLIGAAGAYYVGFHLSVMECASLVSVVPAPDGGKRFKRGAEPTLLLLLPLPFNEGKGDTGGWGYQ
jgi:hypothetical protein